MYVLLLWITVPPSPPPTQLHFHQWKPIPRPAEARYRSERCSAPAQSFAKTTYSGKAAAPQNLRDQGIGIQGDGSAKEFS
jgi:hypothetical protein